MMPVLKNAPRLRHRLGFQGDLVCALYGMLAAFKAKIGAGIPARPYRPPVLLADMMARETLEMGAGIRLLTPGRPTAPRLTSPPR